MAMSAHSTTRTHAVIFDFDGVLVDSEPLHEWAILRSVEDRGWSCSHEQFIRHIVGRGDENAYRRIAEWNGASISEDEIRKVLTRKWGLMREGIAGGKFTIQIGAAEAVKLAAGNVPTGVCSGSVRSTVKPMLEAIGLMPHLRTLVCGDDVARMKPDPEGYLRAARELEAEPARCVAIEDTATGVQAAKNAGMRVIAVGHTMPRDMLTHADVYVERIGEIDRAMLLGT